MNSLSLSTSRLFRSALFGLILLFVMTVFFNLAIKEPLKKKLELTESNNMLQSQIMQGDALKSLNSRLNKAENELDEIKKKLYFQSEGRNSNEIVPYVVKVLYEISKKYNIRLQGVTPLEVKRVLMLEELPFDISISGSYPQIYNWLSEAESALNPIAVKHFSIRPASREPGVAMKMRVVSYRLPAEEG